MKKPELPPLLILKSPSAYYVYTYRNAWDAEKKRSRRVNCRKVGVVTSGEKEGPIRWDEAFLEEYPELAGFLCERKGKEYLFTPTDSGGNALQDALSMRKRFAGATWALDRIAAESGLEAAAARGLSAGCPKNPVACLFPAAAGRSQHRCL